MKATELMIGDWVMYQDKPIQVQFIYNDGYEDKVAEMEELYSPNFNEVEPYLTKKEISIKTISPIPLTPEILKKNGWKRTGQPYEWESGIWVQKWNLPIDTGLFQILDCPKYDGFTWKDIELKSVHALQHALRLCGLEKLADNFQI